MKSSSSQPAQQPSFIKFKTVTKYQSYMFEIVNISPQQQSHFRIKEFKNKEYTYIKQTQLKCEDILIRNAIYKVDKIHTWIYDKDNGETYGCTKYHISLHSPPKDEWKTKPITFLFDLPDKSIAT